MRRKSEVKNKNDLGIKKVIQSIILGDKLSHPIIAPKITGKKKNIEIE